MREEDPLVCHCLAVSEVEVQASIDRGADTLEAVGHHCEAGTGCQSCHGAIRTMLQDQAVRDLARSRSPKTLHQLRLFNGHEGHEGHEGVQGGRSITPAGSHRRPAK